MTKINDYVICEDFFSMGDSMLLDSGIDIAVFHIDKDDTKYGVIIATQGSVRVDDLDTDDSYWRPSEFPKELKDGIKNGDVDTNRFSIESNNWYEIMLLQIDSNNIIHSDVMECEPKDFTDIDDLKNYVVEFVDDFID